MGTADFILPGALTEIENEAFVGGGMEIVSCPDGLKRIGVRAFAQCGKLRQIYIPPTVTSIADDAFEDCSAGLIIYCKAGSAAESFALEHDYEFGIVK